MEVAFITLCFQNYFLIVGAILYSQLTFQHVLPSHRTAPMFFREVSFTLIIFQLLKQRYAIRTPLCIYRCMRISHRTDTSHCSGAQGFEECVGDLHGVGVGVRSEKSIKDMAFWRDTLTLRLEPWVTRAWEKFTCAYYEVQSSVYFCIYVLILSVGYRWLHISFWRWWRPAVQGVRSC